MLLEVLLIVNFMLMLKLVLDVKMDSILIMMYLLMFVFNKLKLKNVINIPQLLKIDVMYALMILLWLVKKEVVLL